MRIDWRGSAHWEWPVAVMLLLALALDGAAEPEAPRYDTRLALAVALTVSALALVAGRLPVVAGAGIAAVLLLWTVVLRLTGWEIVTTAAGLSATELAAVLAALAAVVRRPPPRVAAGLAGLLLGGCLVVHLVRPRHPDSADDLVTVVVLLVAALLTGWYLRTRDAEQARRVRTAVLAAQQRERVALARELHDVVAHHIGGMVVQAQAAQAVPDPAMPARVLPLIERAGTDAAAAMRLMVTALRRTGGDGPPPRPTDLAVDLHAVTASPAGGLPVRLTLELSRPVPAEIATAVLRLVQESVTNARRYATGAAEITAAVETTGRTVRVRVDDDGRGTETPKDSGGGGFGLTGMRERVHLLGGSIEAGPRPDGGWRVTAELPLPPD